MPCYIKDGRAMRPKYISYSTLILFTLTANILCADLIWFWTNLSSGNFVYFCKSDVSGRSPLV